MPSLRGVTLLLASLFFAANLIAATEIAVGTPAVVSAPGTRSSVATASDGRDFLVVWNDTRTTGELGNSRTLASRVTREGKVLDPFGIIVDEALGGAPHVFFAGGAYVVLGARANAFYAARIAPDGTIITPPRIVAHGSASSPRYAATNGKTIVIVHSSVGSSYGISATVLDLETNLIAVHSLVPGTPNGPPIRSGATIASNGDGYVVLWGSLTPPRMWPDADLDAMRLDANGTPVDPAERTIGTAWDIRIAGSTGGYMFLAREPDRRTTEVITTRALATDLSLGAAQVIPAGMPLHNASLIGLRDRFLFFSYSFGGSAMDVHDVAADGSLSNARTIVRSPAGFLTDFPAVASNGSEMLVAWLRVKPPLTEWYGSDYSVEAQIFDAASFAPKSDAVLLTKSANEQQHPAIAYGPHQHLVVWSERDGLWATRVENGISLDGRGIQLAQGPTGPASVVFDGESYIVAWWQLANPVAIYARFISPAGELDEPLRFESPSAYVTLATSGPATLMLWGETTIHATRLDRATRTASAPITVPSNPGYALDLTAAWNGTHFLVAWAEHRFDEMPLFHPEPRHTRRIAGLRLTESLGVVDATPRILGQSPDGSMYSSLASDGRDWLLVWTNEYYDLRARRITADGTPQGPLAGVVVGLPAIAIPAVIWDGSRYAVAWRAADRHALTLPTHLAYISRDVNVTTTIVVAPHHGYAIYEERVALSRAASGVAVAYSRPSWEPQFGGVDRVFVKTFAQRRRALR